MKIESTELFRALSDTTRQKLVQLLLIDELSVTELVDALNQPQSTISRHLGVLHKAGLVQFRKSGTTAYYKAMVDRDDKELQQRVLSWLKSQPLAAGLQERLRRVLRGRGENGVAFFDRLGKRWDELRMSAFGEAFAFEAMLGLLDHDWTVADIGTGTGFLLPSLADQFNEVLAVEPSEAMLECARQRVAEGGWHNVKFCRGDLGRLPIKDQSCDLAMAGLVIHHVAEPRLALLELHRILRPGGRVLIVEQHAHESQKFYETMQDRWWGFDPMEFSKWVSDAGFFGVRFRSLETARARSGVIESPRLFAVVAERRGTSSTPFEMQVK